MVQTSDTEAEHVHPSRDRKAQFHQGRVRPALEGLTQLGVGAVEQPRHDRQHPSILGYVADVQVLNRHASILRDSDDARKLCPLLVLLRRMNSYRRLCPFCGSSSLSVQGHELGHLMTKSCPTN
jgi:hypothetical protein